MRVLADGRRQRGQQLGVGGLEACLAGAPDDAAKHPGGFRGLLDAPRRGVQRGIPIRSQHHPKPRGPVEVRAAPTGTPFRRVSQSHQVLRPPSGPLRAGHLVEQRFGKPQTLPDRTILGVFLHGHDPGGPFRLDLRVEGRVIGLDQDFSIRVVAPLEGGQPETEIRRVGIRGIGHFSF